MKLFLVIICYILYYTIIRQNSTYTLQIYYNQLRFCILCTIVFSEYYLLIFLFSDFFFFILFLSNLYLYTQKANAYHLPYASAFLSVHYILIIVLRRQSQLVIKRVLSQLLRQCLCIRIQIRSQSQSVTLYCTSQC